MTTPTGRPGRRFSLSRRSIAILACTIAGAGSVLTASALPAHATTGFTPAVVAAGSSADLVVTEIAYGGLASGTHAYSGDSGDGEYVELTNIGGAAQDVSSWFFDTSANTTITTPSPTAGTPLSGLATASGPNTVIQPGESVIITDLTPADFRTEWGLRSTVKVVNDGSFTLKSSGSIYISNGTTVLDQISYNLSTPGKGKSAFVSAAHVADQQAAGGASFGPTLPSTNGWTVSTVADSEGSWTSAAGSVGSPAASTLGTATPTSVRTTGVTVSGGSNQTATVGTAFSFTGLSASGGTGSYTWTAPALSGTGLSISASTGAITGMPTAVATINVTVTATDTASSSGSTSFTITVGSGIDPNWANIVINEITSDNSDNTELTSKLPPALYTALNASPNSASDLVELYNKGTQAVSITGWKQADSHGAASATVFSGRVFNVSGTAITSIPAHGFGVFQSGQGLGSGGDAVQIYLPDGTLVDSVTYGAAQAGYDESVDPSSAGPTTAEVYHALARCPDGGGAVNTNSNDTNTAWFSVKVASFGSSNASSCDNSTDPSNAVMYFNEQPPTGLPGNCTPSAPSGSNSVSVPDAVAWPTTDPVSTVDNQCEFVTAQDPTGNDMSSLVFSADGSVLWGAQNKNHVWKLVKDPTTGKFLPATDNSWSNGKAITFTGTDPNASQPDDEGLTVGGNGNLFVTSERDNANNNVSKDEVLEYDPTAAGTTLAPVQQWDLTSEFVPSVIAATGSDANLGFEGVTYVPDSFLTSHGFHDQHLNKTYDPADYPGHGSGLFFLAMEKNGHVYAYALNSDGSYQRVADIDTGIDGTSAIADVQFNANDEGIWTDCDNDCGVVDSLLRINASGNFTRVVSYNRPAGLPNDNLEGFAIAPASTATAGKRQVVWSDDGIYGEGNAWNSSHTTNTPSADWGHSLYSATLPATSASTVGVSADANPAVTGQAVTFTATVSGPSGVLKAPTGTVEFQANGSDLPGCAAVSLVSGAATCGAPHGVAAGSYSIVALYSGDGSFAAGDDSTSPYVETVHSAATTTSVAASPNPVDAGTPVTLTATVAVTSPGSTAPASPTGSVEFAVGGTAINGCSTASISTSGTAVCNDPGDLAAGSDTVTVSYSGDTNFAASTGSGTVSVTAKPSTYLFVDENPAGPNEVRNYLVNPDGSTTLLGSYATGHPGSNATWVAGARAAYASATNHLYALNLGDDTVSVFAVDSASGALTLQSTTPSLDATSIAVNPAGTVLYAGGSTNELSANQLATYSINSDGSINPGPIQLVSADVDGLAVSPDGSEVAAAYPGTGPIDPSVQLWSTDAKGDLVAQSTLDEPCATDVRFTSVNTLDSASCYHGAVAALSLSSGQLSTTASTPATSQTLAAGPDGTVYFETASGLQGTSSSSLAPGPTTADANDTAISSMTVTPDNSRLFVANVFGTTINDYGIGAGHALTLLGQIPIPAGVVPTVVAYTPAQSTSQSTQAATVPPATGSATPAHVSPAPRSGARSVPVVAPKQKSSAPRPRHIGQTRRGPGIARRSSSSAREVVRSWKWI